MIKDSKDYSDRYKSIYSTLFGLGIGFFLTHAFKYWKQVSGPSGIQFTGLNSLYIIIEVYLFFNYFRYLFGLRRFAEMTGQTFMPIETDWSDSSKSSSKVFVYNILKILVTNVGIFQLLIFSIMSMLIIPELDSAGNTRDFYRYFYQNHILLMKWFFVFDLVLLVSDFLAVFLFNRLDPGMIAFRIKLKNKESTTNNSEEKNESRQMNIWMASNIIEITICIIAVSLLSGGVNSDLTTCTVLMSIKLILLLAEMSGMYYFIKRFSPLKKLISFINGTN